MGLCLAKMAATRNGQWDDANRNNDTMEYDTKTPNKLALINSLFKIAQSAPHGTNHAGYTSADAIVRLGQFDSVDVFVDEPENVSYGVTGSGSLSVPQEHRVDVRHLRELPYCSHEYLAIYGTGATWLDTIPFALRPEEDSVALITEIDMSHARQVWMNMLVGFMTGGLRSTDGFIFKSDATRRLYERVWAQWREEGYVKMESPVCLVSPNPIDLSSNQRDEALRERVRKSLGIASDDVVFLTFNRLERGTKGDLPSLVTAWARVVKSAPNAVLMLAGAMAYNDAHFLEQVRSLARHLGVSRNVILIPNPFDLFADARNALMSASDVFVHASLGLEESAPLTILEAMAHQLPPIVSSWSGMVDQVVDQVFGFVVNARYVPAPEVQSRVFWGRHAIIANRDAATFACLDPAVFVEIATRLASNADLRQGVGLNAYERVSSRFNIDKIGLERVAFVRQVAAEARREFRGSSQRVLVSVEMITDTLAMGSTLSYKESVRLGDAVTPLHMGLWLNERFLQLGHSILEQIKDDQCVSIEALLCRVLTQADQSMAFSVSELWSSDFGRHFQWVLLRLIAGGFLMLETTVREMPRFDRVSADGPDQEGIRTVGNLRAEAGMIRTGVD